VTTRLTGRLGDRSLATQIAARDLTDRAQIHPYAAAFGGTQLIAAAACAFLGTLALALTRAPRTTTTHRDTRREHAMTQEKLTQDLSAETAVLRYTIKPEHLDEHLSLIRDVYADLASYKPPTFHWATYQVENSREFVEVAIGHPLPGPLPELPAFTRYRVSLDDRCEAKQFDMVSTVGSYTSR